MIKLSAFFLTLASLSVTLQAGMVPTELSDGVYLISQKPIVQLGNTTYYLSLSGKSEKAQLQRLREGSPAQMWEIKNTPDGVTLKNKEFNCYGHVGSLWQVLPIGAPLFCTQESTSVPQVFQPKHVKDDIYQIKHFNWSDPSLFYLMHTVPLDVLLGSQETYGNISFVPAATSFATDFSFKRVEDVKE